MSHAQMLSGEEGFGALPLALAFAQYILCEDPQENDSCGTCPSCAKAQKLIHPDLHFVFPVTTTSTNTKPVSDDYLPEWREALLEDGYLSSSRWYHHLGIENKLGMIYTQESNEIIKKLNLKTFEAEFKVMIIWQPERMNQTCSNKLLKIIEEPPPKTLFLLVSIFPEQMIPTLLSRVQNIRVPGIDDKTLKSGLTGKYGLTEADASKIIRLADGSVARAREYLQSGEDLEYNLNQFIKWMRLCFKKDVKGILDWVDEMSVLGREKKRSFFQYSMRLLRENFLLNTMPEHKDRLNRLTGEEYSFSEKFSTFIKEENIPVLYSEINKAVADIEANAYAKTVLLDLCIKVMGQIR